MTRQKNLIDKNKQVGIIIKSEKQMKKIKAISVIMIFLSLLTNNANAEGFLREKLKERMEMGNSLRNVHTESPTYADFSYGNNSLQKMDVYLPTIKKFDKSPILIMVHGGGWKRGDKKVGAALTNKLPYFTQKGMILVSLNYRLTPEANPYEQAQDIAKALVVVQENAEKWGGDPNKIVLMGHSAGAHLVTLVTADARYNFAKGAKPWLGTVSLDGAGVDIEKSMNEKKNGKILGDIYDNAFGNDPNLWHETSPMAQLKQGAYPILMVCSSIRNDKPCKDTQDFVNKAKNLGVKADMMETPRTHGDINHDVGLDNDLTKRIDQFLKTIGINLNE